MKTATELWMEYQREELLAHRRKLNKLTWRDPFGEPFMGWVPQDFTPLESVCDIEPSKLWIVDINCAVALSNPLSAMCHYRDQHSTERLPVSDAKPAVAGLMVERVFTHKLGLGK